MEPLFLGGLQVLKASVGLMARCNGVGRSPLQLAGRSSSSFQSDNTALSAEKENSKKIIGLVNNLIQHKGEGRLFAVVQVCGKQFKVTNNDIIVVDGYWPPDIGDEIRLEKVLLAGAADFTLIGRPLLPLNQVSVKATVIEKALTHTKVTFRYVKRKQFKNIKFLKCPLTHLRINSIELLGQVNELGDVDGNKDRVF